MTNSSDFSCADQFRQLPESERERRLRALTDGQRLALKYDWRFWARPKQLPPTGSWSTWLIRAGRGFGKTRTGAEWVRGCVEPGTFGRLALVGPTAADARDVMVEGESGILAISPPWFRPKFEPAKRRLVWPNGAMATLYSADEPERLRGPQHDAAWLDELMAWRFLQEAYDQVQFGLRLGQNPQQLITTTPKPLKLLLQIQADPNTVTTIGSTYENAGNLAPSFLTKIVGRYEGTRLGRQELNAEVLDDNPRALWNRRQLDELRIKPADMPTLKRIVVGDDPAVTSKPDSDETGIISAGVAESGHAYVIQDDSMTASPDTWGKRTVKTYHELKADRVVAEVNNGGDLVESLLRTIDPNVSYKGVHAAKGKYTRAEPVAALYEQGKVHHVGSFPILEDQMCDYDPSDPNQKSPDRMDALVWALTELMLVDTDTGMLDYLRGRVQDNQRREASEDEKGRTRRAR